jgi:hypothetical protein
MALVIRPHRRGERNVSEATGVHIRVQRSDGSMVVRSLSLAGSRIVVGQRLDYLMGDGVAHAFTSPWTPWAVPVSSTDRPSHSTWPVPARCFSAFRRRHLPCRSDQTAMDQRVNTCPRCGGELRVLRRFTRMGRTFLVTECQMCRYAQYEPSPQPSA